jgi:drug/metabolite transporter (DMT)-like permease
MTWFFIAIIGPFLYSFTNHIDKILLDKYFKAGGVGTLILFSSLLSIVALPFIFWGDSDVLSVSIPHILILSFVGGLNVLLLWLYLLALKEDEASVIIVFYQLVPVLGLVLGFFILGEILSTIQLIAMCIIIFGTTIISFTINDQNKFIFRKRTVLLMLGASFCWALESVIFKAIALEENVWRSLFWEHVMLVLVGVTIFVCIPSYRVNFISALKLNSKAILSINFLNEVLYMLGNIVIAFAYLLAPIALILLTQSFQPIFVLAIGIFLTIFFPKISQEKIERKDLYQKIIAIIITGIGTFILLVY